LYIIVVVKGAFDYVGRILKKEGICHINAMLEELWRYAMAFQQGWLRLERPCRQDEILLSSQQAPCRICPTNTSIHSTSVEG
jgi:hypothetical protein